MNNYNEFLSRREYLLKSWPLSTSVVPVACWIAVYFLFSLVIGPAIMKKREPLVLKNVLTVYNAVQVFFNIWLCRQFDIRKYFSQCVLSYCNLGDPEYQVILQKMAWWYMINKLVDFLDTVFIVLRKKNSQLNLLHLYHHPATFFFAYYHLTGCGGFQIANLQYTVGMYLNSVIHVIMYSYYLLSGLGPKFQKYLWWKKYLTKLQIAQLVFLSVWAAGIGMFCTDFTHFVLLAGNPIVLVLLFTNFYRRTYNESKKLQ